MPKPIITLIRVFVTMESIKKVNKVQNTGLGKVYVKVLKYFFFIRPLS